MFDSETLCETTFPFAGFEILHMDIQEPAPGENVQQSEFIEIPVERRDGTRGVVEVRWVATIDGKVCPVFPHKRKIAKLYLMEIWLHRAK